MTREQHQSARSTTSDATPYRDAYLRLRAAGLTQINALRLASAGYDVLAMVPAVALALLPAPPVTPVAAAPMSVVSAPPTLDGPTTPAPPRVSRSAHRPPLPTPSTSPLRGWQRWADVTAYCSTGSRNAAGLWPQIGDVAVLDRSIPFGTRLRIAGQTFTVRDWIGHGSQVDIYMGAGGACQVAANRWGRQRLLVEEVR